LWHRWDSPHPVGSSDLDERQAVLAAYLTDNWRAHRTWGLSANSPWEYAAFWKRRDGVHRGCQALEVDWEHLQRPGFSADYAHRREWQMARDLERSDWVPTASAQALIRNNRPLLASIGGQPRSFTSKDHNFLPGQTVEKQLIVINNSRQTVACRCEWALGLPRPVTGNKKFPLPPGPPGRIPPRFQLPPTPPPPP